MTESSQPEMGVISVLVCCPRCEVTWESPKPEPTRCLCGSHLYKITVIGQILVPVPVPHQETLFNIPHWMIEWRWKCGPWDEWTIYSKADLTKDLARQERRAAALSRRFPAKVFRVRPAD